MAKIQDFTKGNIYSQMLLYSLPLILSNLLQVVFSLADVAVVGRFAGADALGSVGCVLTLVHLFEGIPFGMGSGVNVVVARYFGAGTKKGTEEAIHTSFLICMFIAVLEMVFGLVIIETILKWIGTKPQLFAGALTYMRLFFFALPGIALFNYGQGVLTAMGDTQTPLLYLSISGVLNVLLNLLFVIKFQMSVAGVALASLITQYLSGFSVLFAVASLPKEYAFKIRSDSLKVNQYKANMLLKVGMAAGLQNCIFNIANTVIQGGVNTFDTLTVSGNSAAANSDIVVYSVLDAFYMSGSSFVSQNYGAKNYQRIRQSAVLSIGLAFGSALIMGVFLYNFGEEFLNIFTTEAPVVQAGMARLRVMAFSYCICTLMDGSIAVLRGLGIIKVPMLIVITGSCLFRIFWVMTVFAHYQTMGSLYLVYAFSWSITGAAMLIYLVHSFKKMKNDNLC